MRINYIILAHKNPNQIKRLITRLSENWTYFYLHLDANINIRPFSETLSNFNNITFLNENERFPGIWGDIGIVKGTLAAMRKIAERNEKGYTILLSGQDYPIKDNNAILRFLEKKKSNYIDINPILELWGPHGLDRIKKYKINKSTKRGHFLLLPTIFDRDFYSIETIGKLNFLRKSRCINKINLIFKKRQFPNYLTPYGGSQWWALTSDTIKDVLNYVDENPDYLKYHHFSLLPDEIFFHSIIMKLEKDGTISNIAPSLTYVNWERNSGPLPVTFTIQDYEELKSVAKEKLFARKFDQETNEDILNRIDNLLIKHQE
jgi:hypothetical protein